MYILSSSFDSCLAIFNSVDKAMKYAEWITDCNLIWEINKEGTMWRDKVSDQEFIIRKSNSMLDEEERIRVISDYLRS